MSVPADLRPRRPEISEEVSVDRGAANPSDRQSIKRGERRTGAESVLGDAVAQPLSTSRLRRFVREIDFDSDRLLSARGICEDNGESEHTICSRVCSLCAGPPVTTEWASLRH